LEAEKQALKKEEKRFQEWQEACKERDRVTMEIGRCEAAMELTELARKTLRDTAPAVAQHLCSRIAKRAQGVFNQINPDPIELAWDSERYSLRVTPGDRRFSMLSGGEQTKLALAMTLAMIEEFSGLRFCVFDEPTYAVDADSTNGTIKGLRLTPLSAMFSQSLNGALTNQARRPWVGMDDYKKQVKAGYSHWPNPKKMMRDAPVRSKEMA
jgi:exonuclease SbcC